MTIAPDDRQKVLYYVERYLPPSQAFVAQQARALARYQPAILAGSTMASLDRDLIGFPVHDIRASPAMRAGELALKTVRLPAPALFPAVRQADLVHAHFGKNGYVIEPLAARAAGKPLVTTFHGFDATFAGKAADVDGFNQVRFFAKGREQMAKGAGWQIAVSDFIQDRLLALGFPQSRIFRHYIGVDTSLFSAPTKPRRKGLVVSVARFVEYKGHRLMIEALERVAKAGTPVEFIMIGEGPLRDEIEALARRSLPKVEIREKQTQAQIRDLLSEAELYLHGAVTLANGHAEAFGIANLEAQAMGAPVVAFRSGGVGEAVEEGATGFLAAERDVAAMADHIGRLLNDQPLWNAFSERAPKMVAERFDIRRQTALLEDYYDSVLDAHKHGEARR